MNPLIPEDGTGLATADSYVSIAAADTYCADRGYAAWATATNDQKTAALRAATEFIDNTYNFKGTRKHPGSFPKQALEWPRYDMWIDNVYVSDTWPVPRLVKATCELALRSLSAPLIVDADDTQVTEETVGPITQRFGNSRYSGQTHYSVAERALSPFLRGGTGQVRIARG